MKDLESQRPRLLASIESILGSSYSLTAVIRKLYRTIGRTLDTSNFYIALYNRKDNTVSFEVYTIDGFEQNVTSRKLSKGLTEFVINSKHPVRVNQDLSRFCKRFGVKPIGRDAKSWLGVPMIYKNNVEGVIAIQDYGKENAYSAADESFLASIANRAAVVIANTRLIEEEMKRAKELAVMNQIAHRLTKSLHIDAICETVTKSIMQNFKNYNIAVFLTEEGELVLKKLSAGFKDEVPRDLKMKFGQGIVGEVAKASKTFVANDVRTHPKYLAFGQTCTMAEVAIPLKISRKTIGVLDVQCNKVGVFDPNSVRVLELIADRLSAALHNARLYNDATTHAKELAVSFSIAQSVVSTLELDDVLHRVLKVIRQTFGFANVAILLVDKKQNELYIKAAHGYSRYITKKVRLSITRKEGVTGYVAATGKMYYAPDISKVPFYYKGKATIKSEAAIPLKIKGEVIGVLDIESDQLNAFSERDLRIFSVFASQAAVAIENARLFDETKSLSLTDGLTKIANRRHFDLIVDSEIRKARSYSRPLSLAMVDLDDFKYFNDRYGHQAGDKILIRIAQNIRRNIRDTDFVARYGGEEFVIVFPETNNLTSLKVAERIRSAISSGTINLAGKRSRKITVSIGVATYPAAGLTTIELISNADRALYRAKTLGKNRVETVQ